MKPIFPPGIVYVAATPGLNVIRSLPTVPDAIAHIGIGSV